MPRRIAILRHQERAVPFHIDPDTALAALDNTLLLMRPPGAPIPTLTTPAASSPQWSCNDFGPTLLRQVIGGGAEPASMEYKAGDTPLPTFADGDFVNIMMQGDPSGLNHNFNILVSGPQIYLFEAFLGHTVQIVRAFDAAAFQAQWRDLSAGQGGIWKPAYLALFGVDPDQVAATGADAVWFQSQYVSV